MANGETESPNIKGFTSHYKVSISLDKQDISKAAAVIKYQKKITK